MADAQSRQASGSSWRRQLAVHAEQRPDAVAVSRRGLDGSYELTSYRELLSKVDAYAALFEASTEPGQVIPLCLARGPEAIAAMFGALVSERGFCTINPKLRVPQLELILSRLRSPIALVDSHGLATLRGERAPSSPIDAASWHVVAGAALTRASQRVLGELAASTSVVRHDLEPLPSAAPSTVSGSADSAAGCCLFTSGSTGTPKGVLISRADLRARAHVEVQWLGLRDSDVLLNVLPFSFDVGLNQVLATLSVGAELVVLDSWLPADVLATVAARGVTGLAAVPTIWTDFLASGQRFDREAAHRTLRFLTVSGGDLSPAQHQSLPAIAPGVGIFKTYGQTEAFRIASLRPEEYATRPLSIGRALPGGHLYIVGEDGREAPAGTPGEVVHSGTGTMLGYLGAEGVVDGSDKLRPNPFQGALDENPLAIFSGDLGVLDQDGYLTLAGRRDDMVKIAGNRVYPSELKALLTELPGVASAEVVVVRRERVCLAAFVVPFADAKLEEPALRRLLQERAPSYLIPELLVASAELPRTSSGKPDRNLLAERALELLAAPTRGGR